MKLPNWEKAYVPPQKLTDYLLSETHPVGRLKAQFLRAGGFDEANVDELEQNLLNIARDEDVKEAVSSSYGTKFIIEGMLIAPSRGPVPIRTVWIIEPTDDRPRFVTAYPL